MRIVVDIGHPSQVHFFKNFIIEMEKKGHQVLITVSEKDIAIDLLRAYGFKYINLRSYGESLFKKIVNVPIMDIKLYKAVREIKPDIFLGFGSVRAAHVAWLLRKPSIIFDGDDFTFPYYKWFADTICVFSGFEKDGKNIINIPGYKELAYLHPRTFKTDHTNQSNGPVTILRFVSRAFHDVGKEGFDLEFKRRLVQELSKYSTVYISSEAPLTADLEGYRLKIKPEEMHYFLSRANLLVTDSGSMTTEAAVMGIPVVRCNSFIGQHNLGIFKELEDKYGLIFSYRNSNQALIKAIELAQIPDIRIAWEQKRKCLLQDKIDVTSFMIWFVEHYPQSIAKAPAFIAHCLKSQALKAVNTKIMNMDQFNNLKQHTGLWETFVNEEELSGTESKYIGFDQSRVMTPVVSEQLIKQGYDISYPGDKKFAICLTHDVDDIYPPFSHRVLSGLFSLKKGDWNGFKKHLFWNMAEKQTSPYINFQKIMDLEKKYNAKSSFYFMTTKQDPRRFRYNIEEIADEVKLIAESGWEVGLHGGYYSFHDIEAIKQEKRRLENAIGREVIGYRNHYLRFHNPDTWELLEKCGFKYDTTYGYTNMVGFRNGMCHPFRPYHLQRQQWMDIYELPLHVMESAMFDFAKPQEAWELVKQLLEKAESNKGVITVLWHNNVFSCPFRDRWAELYEKILQYGIQRDAWMASGEEIYRWWEENGY